MLHLCSIEYGDVGIKKAAERQKNRTEAEMKKMADNRSAIG